MNVLRDKPNLLFLIAIRIQWIYEKMAVIAPKLLLPTYHKKLLRTVLHRTIDHRGAIIWETARKTHREDGPAIICHGNKYWMQNNLLHRTDGPAVEYREGNVVWFYEGKKHRDGGPAVIRYHQKKRNPDGTPRIRVQAWENCTGLMAQPL